MASLVGHRVTTMKLTYPFCSIMERRPRSPPQLIGETLQALPIAGIGLIRPLGSAADGSGYTPQSGYYTSYLLRFVNQTITYSETAAGEKIPEVSGNAATSGLLDALNAYSTSFSAF